MHCKILPLTSDVFNTSDNNRNTFIECFLCVESFNPHVLTMFYSCGNRSLERSNDFSKITQLVTSSLALFPPHFPNDG